MIQKDKEQEGRGIDENGEEEEHVSVCAGQASDERGVSRNDTHVVGLGWLVWLTLSIDNLRPKCTIRHNN